MLLSKSLRKALLDCGESIYAIAKGSGVDWSVINRFINDERSITMETADKLAVFLELELRHRKRPRESA